jgi:hypothetical protein
MAKYVDIYVLLSSICKNIARKSINRRVRTKGVALRSMVIKKYHKGRTSTTSDFSRAV